MPVVTPSAFSRVPPPGTPAGDERRDQFYHDLLAILGPTQLLWTPETGDTTTSTSRDRYGVTITYDATVASRFSPLGSLWALDFDGTDDEADTPDLARFSFGDGNADQPFSIVALVNPDTVAAGDRVLLAKENSAAAEEYRFQIATANPELVLTDESASAIISVIASTVSVVGTWTLVAATYDGSGSNMGLNIYTDGVSDISSRSASGTYVAMENTAALVHLGARYTTKETFLNGKMAFVALTGKALSPDENLAIKELVNAVADLSL